MGLFRIDWLKPFRCSASGFLYETRLHSNLRLLALTSKSCDRQLTCLPVYKWNISWKCRHFDLKLVICCLYLIILSLAFQLAKKNRSVGYHKSHHSGNKTTNVLKRLRYIKKEKITWLFLMLVKFLHCKSAKGYEVSWIWKKGLVNVIDFLTPNCHRLS